MSKKKPASPTDANPNAMVPVESDPVDCTPPPRGKPPQEWTAQEVKNTISRVAQTGWVGTCVSGKALSRLYGGDESLATDAVDGVMFQVFKDVQPRGQVEKMLCEQMVLLHSQALVSHNAAAGVADLAHRDRALNAASRLLSDFRKTLGALQAFRDPPRQVIHAKQVNQAGQQVVVNGDVTPNELGGHNAE